MIDPKLAADMTEPQLAADRAEAALDAEPRDSTELTEPIEPMDKKLPTDAMLRTEPRLAIDSTESSDAIDHFDAMCPTISRLDDHFLPSRGRHVHERRKRAGGRITGMSELHLRPGAGVVLFDGAGHILLMRRKGEGTWGLPGGAIEAGESWAAAALRECREETGWHARIDELLGIYSDPSTQVYRYPDGELAHFISAIFLATAIEQVGFPDDDEASELQWTTAEALPAPLFAADIPILRDALDTTVQRPVVG